MSIFDGQLALITGGGRGIGAATALTLAQRGAKVILADVDGNSATQAASEFVKQGYDAVGLALDVADRGGCFKVAEGVTAEHGDISILVNNAGVGGGARLGDSESAEQWDRSIGINLSGGFNVTSAFLSSLKRTKGCIVNISSVVAFTSGFAQVGYTASKGGMRSLTQAMCRELTPFGIRVNAVAPGYVHTEGMGGKGNEKVENWLSWHCPMQRHGEAHEVATAIAFLCSPDASFVNGVTLPVDGGYLVI
jgi:NAD(P)-dependent dehydrogenase (short-subunit alcohol dehydrogenase family)